MEQNVNNLIQYQNLVQKPSKEVGSWTKLENLKYAVFLQQNKSVFSQKKRGKQKFFLQMSQFIKTRTSIQCRCHHQKIFKKFKSRQKIVYYFKNLFQVKNLEAYLKQKPTFVEKKERNHIQTTQTQKEQKNELLATTNNINQLLSFTSWSLQNFYDFWNKMGYNVYPLYGTDNPLMWMSYGNVFSSLGNI